jgi:dihydroorotase/N-acyl-D-amino-acid deacylase
MIARLATISVIAVLSACARPAPATAPGPDTPFDLVIENGRVVDGTGAAWFYGDVAIRGDRIARVARRGALRGRAARMRLDASGLVVAPGFIDIHSGSGMLRDGRSVSKVTQGITTEIAGEGFTPGPANERTSSPGAAFATSGDRPGVIAFAGHNGFGAWLDSVSRMGISPNFGSFVGAATVRVYAKGQAIGDATPAELDTMRAVVRRAMENGAFGVGSALIYPPGNYASTRELVELARAMAPYGGMYITHMRSEADQLLEAIDEAIRIGREGGVPVEIYHLKAGGRRNWPKMAQAIAKIDSARSAGLDVQANMYPYPAGATGLSACTPPWASEGGRLLANLRDAATRTRIRAEMQSDRTEWENLCRLSTPDGVLLLGLTKDENRQFNGKRLSDVTAATGKTPEDAVIDLLVAEGQRIGTVFMMMSEDNVRLGVRQPWIKFGTDAGGVDPDSARSLTHPRAYGTFPRVVGRYVRDERLLSLEEAVRKSTSASATRLQIPDRGILREGFFADVVLFDAATIADRATFDAPHQLSTGVRHVLVNGTFVVRDGRHTGAKPGRILRGPGYRR